MNALHFASLNMNYDGGAGSGNWGHLGRPGIRGGSGPGGRAYRLTTPSGGYASLAAAYKENARFNKTHKGDKKTPAMSYEDWKAKRSEYESKMKNANADLGDALMPHATYDEIKAKYDAFQDQGPSQCMAHRRLSLLRQALPRLRSSCNEQESMARA